MDLDRPGNFQLECKDYTLAEFDSGSVNLVMQFRVLNCWDEESGQWIDWTKTEDGSPLDITVEGMINLIKKKNTDGSSGGVNERQCEALMECCGWNGMISALQSKSWKPNNCQGLVKKDEYKGKVSHKVAFINPFDATPGGGGLTAATVEAAQRLQDQWGASLRALASKAKDKVQKPSGKPKPPTKVAPPVTAGANSVGGEIPF